MESGQSDELVLESHSSQFFLEFFHLCGAQMFLPVEGRRTVVGEELVRVDFSHTLGEFLGISNCRMRGLHPDEIAIWSIADRPFHAVLNGSGVLQPVESLDSSSRVPVNEGMVTFVDIAEKNDVHKLKVTDNLVRRRLLSASVLATMIVGTPQTSAAKREAFKWRMC